MVATVWALSADGTGSPSYSADDLRRATALLPFAANEQSRWWVHGGVRYSTGDDLKVSVSGMTATVGGGSCIVNNAGDLSQGPYAFSETETQSFTIPARDTVNARIDAVWVRIYDDENDSTGERRGAVEYVAGSPNSVPSAPTTPARSLLLATVLVPPTGSIVVTDQRGVGLAGLGGVIPAPSATFDPTAFVSGQLYWRMDTRRLYIHDGTSGAEMFQFAPVWTNQSTFGTGWQSSPSGTVQWHKESTGWANLRGFVQRTSGTVSGDNLNVMTLHSSIWPTRTLAIPVAGTYTSGASSTTARIAIGTTGRVDVYAPDDAAFAWISLDGVRYSTF